MTRSTIGLFGALALVVGLLIGDHAKAGTVAVNPNVLVDGTEVTLGDIFEPAGEAASRVVLRAPRPGKRLLLRASEVRRLAAAHDLEWSPTFGDEMVVIERYSRVIGGAEITEALTQALVEAGLEDGVEIELANRGIAIHVAASATAAIAISDLLVEQRTGRFTAVVTAPANDPRAERLRVAGRLHPTQLVPVAARRVSPGEVLQENDFVYERRRSGRIGRGIVTDPAVLIGKAVRRTLRAGEPVRVSEITEPELVARGRTVTMIYRSPGLVLTALGTAVDAGGDGDTVRVMNLQSNTTVHAIVAGPDTVIVPRAGMLALN